MRNKPSYREQKDLRSDTHRLVVNVGEGGRRIRWRHEFYVKVAFQIGVTDVWHLLGVKSVAGTPYNRSIKTWLQQIGGAELIELLLQNCSDLESEARKMFGP